MALFQYANSFDPIHPRQADVTQQDVRQFIADLIESLFHGAELARTTKTWRSVNQHPETLTQGSLVFDDSYRDDFLPNRLTTLFYYSCIGHIFVTANLGLSLHRNNEPVAT